MKAILLAAVASLAFLGPALADVTVDLGQNPSSGSGAFANQNPGAGAGGSGAFVDNYTFQLVGAPQFLTIAGVTNTFSAQDQFITGFTAAVLNTNGTASTADDTFVIGPVGAQACIGVPVGCQSIAGSSTIDAGSYYLQITGDAGVNAGYGGTISTFGVPGPTAGAGAVPVLAGMLLAWYRSRRRQTV